MEQQSPKLPKSLTTVALTVVILCWVAFIVKTLIDGAPDVVQMLIMLIFSVLVAWLVVSNNPSEYEIDSAADAAAEGSTPSTTLGQKADKDDADKDDADKADSKEEPADKADESSKSDEEK